MGRGETLDHLIFIGGSKVTFLSSTTKRTSLSLINSHTHTDQIKGKTTTTQGGGGQTHQAINICNTCKKKKANKNALKPQ